MSHESVFSSYNRDMKYYDEVIKAMEERGVPRNELNERRLGRHIHRAAQQDNNPTLSWEEAALAVERMVAKQEPVSLPASDGHVSIVLETKLDTNYFFPGVSRIRRAAQRENLEVEFHEIDRGWFGRRVYRVSVEGPQDNVERFFDAYHDMYKEHLDEGE